MIPQKITFEIHVDDEYFDLVPRPTKEQHAALKESIKNQGQLVPITVDSTGKIIDWYTRCESCFRNSKQEYCKKGV